MNEILDFIRWAIELGLITIGGALVHFIFQVNKEVAELKSTQIVVLGELRNLKGQAKKVEEWVDLYGPLLKRFCEDVEIEKILEHIEATKSTFKKQEDQLNKLKDIIRQIAKRVNL